MTKKVRDPAARQRIVEAAWATIADVGLKAATVRAIAAEAGVSTGFVMHYFVDKAELAAAVFAHNNLRAAARVVPAQQRYRGIAAVRAIMEALLPLDEARRLEWHIWVAFWHEGEGRGLGSARDGLGDVIGAALHQAIEDGELPASLDVQYEALRLMTLAAGLGLSAGVTPPRTIKAAARRMLDDHLAALAIPAGRR
jgi:AcrR family transcriptional regulator